MAEGVDTADSWATDGHKWLQTPYDCGYAIVRNEEAHRRAMTIAASYLPTAFEGERDPSHFVPELSRRARGFATWAMIKHLGREGIATMVERHCQVARAMAEKLRADNAIAIENDVVLNQFLVRFGADRPDDEADRLTCRRSRNCSKTASALPAERNGAAVNACASRSYPGWLTRSKASGRLTP